MTADHHPPERLNESRRASVRGVSLVEALVALAVMAFGMLGVVGMQSTLRFNGDLSRQRAEAVRLAQEAMEDWRHYGVLTSAEATPEQPAFEDIASTGPEDIERDEFNTVYQREAVVVPEDGDAPRLRQVQVRVSWKDRRGEEQSVLLTSQIGYLPSELIALPALRSDRGPVGRPGGRNPSIPRTAVDRGDGTSRFDPPGTTDVHWIFSNETGLITQICQPDCVEASYWLMSGSVAFALAGSPPSPTPPLDEQAEVPNSTVPAVFDGLLLQFHGSYTSTGAFVVNCYSHRPPAASTTRISYYCAIPRNTDGLSRGTLVFEGGLPLANDVAATFTDARSDRYRICRYTPDRRNLLAPPSVETNAVYNARNPWRYLNPDRSYTDRNFLVIMAGDGTTPSACPNDRPGSPIQSSTWHHPRPV